jgi:hypothetical protein
MNIFKTKILYKVIAFLLLLQANLRIKGTERRLNKMNDRFIIC